MNKEFIIFGVIVGLLLAFVVASRLTGGREYKREDVKINFDHEELPTKEPVVTDKPVISEPPATPVPTEPSVVTPEPDVTDEPVDNPAESQEVNGDDNPDDEFGEPEENMGDGVGGAVTDTQVAYMLAYYVCGLEHALFEDRMTSEMRDAFGTHVNEEPYSTLNGNTSLNDIELSNGILSFEAADGITYKFEITFDGNLVSGIYFVS